jgi:hypothetical protein
MVEVQDQVAGMIEKKERYRTAARICYKCKQYEGS